MEILNNLVELDTPAKRLEYFIRTNFESKSKFCYSMEMRPETLSRYLKGGAIMGKKYQPIAQRLGLNLDWYLTGNNTTVEDSSSKGKSRYKLVPYYSMDVTASYVESFDDIKEEPEYYISCPPLDACDAYFTVFGDSMYPMFASGDMIAVKKLSNHNIIQWGEPHLVVTDSEANNMRTIKLVYPCEDNPDCIVLRASNPRFAGDMVVPKSSVLSIFIIKGNLTIRQM